MSIVTSELSRGAGGGQRAAHVLQLIRLVSTVVVTIADKVMGNAAAVLAGELVLVARLVGAAPLIAGVPAVITSIAPDFRIRARKDERTLTDRLIRVIYDILKELIFLTCRSRVCRGHCYR